MSWLSNLIFGADRPARCREKQPWERAEEELRKRQPPADGSWASWETIPGFKEADEEYRRLLAEETKKIEMEEAAQGTTLTVTRVRAWYTPSEVVAWGVKHGRIV